MELCAGHAIWILRSFLTKLWTSLNILISIPNTVNMAYMSAPHSSHPLCGETGAPNSPARPFVFPAQHPHTRLTAGNTVCCFCHFCCPVSWIFGRFRGQSYPLPQLIDQWTDKQRVVLNCPELASEERGSVECRLGCSPNTSKQFMSQNKTWVCYNFKQKYVVHPTEGIYRDIQ